MSERDAPERAGLTFPDQPRMELDQLLAQLVERAQEVMGAQGRLRGLLRATQTITTGLALPSLLRRIVEAARELVGARYAALGVIGPDGRLTEFVHTGMDPDAVERIGGLPEGKGLLGAVIEDPRPIRLTRLQDDPRSSGFPAGHPPMTSFLGVPIQARGAVFGNLYFADGERGPFSAEDEQLALALAAAAGSAIENARLYETARNQQEWLRASAALTRELLAAETADPLERVVDYLRELASADLVAVFCPAGEGGRAQIGYAAGSGAGELAGRELTAESAVVGAVLASGEPKLGTWPDEAAQGLTPSTADLNLDAVLLVPFAGGDQPPAVLAAARLTSRAAFGEDELEMAAWFADQAAVAVELAQARAEREAAALHDERDRIAAGLQREILQRLYSTGLSLQTTAGLARSPVVATRLRETIFELDDIIAQAHSTVFQPGDGPPRSPEPVRDQVLRVLAEAGDALGFPVSTQLTGKLDEVRSDAVVPFLDEALRLVARHASAQSVEVGIQAEPARTTVTVRYEGGDDLAGPAAAELAALAEQANRRGGTLTAAGGSRLVWSVPGPEGSSAGD
ncbi:MULTISPECIES: GAF domain-containing protein [unclassified Amycolatopsis]|uniref:GAF domain-containing protein n=1 Tax=unclassified Amycolatopsis TaxID=2618356 RepID=UPI001EE79DFD|nr:GAF domain-containing protein [Amycolatopsis sp. Poz14]MCG3754148.1 GAF domain-containing protein [Amycolatopsis sp. Poz14]